MAEQNNIPSSYNIQMDKLTCILCQGPYRQPRMCSQCSQIFCSRCIQNYIKQNHLCPKCGCVLPDLADCTRLIAELKQHVKVSTKKKVINCRIHKLPLKYHCQDCQRSICADCGIIDERHRGHTINPRGENCSTLPRNKLRQYLVSVQQCILKDHSRHQQLVLEREVLKSELRWCRNKLKEYYEEMSAKLEKQADKIMKDIVNDMEEKQIRLQRLKKIKEDVSQILNLGQVSDEVLLEKVSANNQLVDQLDESGDNLVKLESMLEEYRDGTFFQFNRKTITTLNEVYPDYVNHTYELNYESSQYLDVKYSESFFIYGQEWRLKIYPTGNGQSPGHLSLFLEMINAPNSPIGSNYCLQYFFRLELISLNAAGRTISKQYRSPFMDGDCWGYNDFVLLSELPQFLNNGQLIFVVGIKNCSYFDVCENMKRYIRKLEDEKTVLQELMGARSLEVSNVQIYARDSLRNSSMSDNLNYI